MNPFGFFGGEEQRKIAEQAKKLGPDKIRLIQGEWPKLIAEAKSYMADGKDPKYPQVQELARRWMQLVGEFTGGDAKVQAGLTRMYKESGDKLKQQFGSKVPDWDVIEYIMKALI